MTPEEIVRRAASDVDTIAILIASAPADEHEVVEPCGLCGHPIGFTMRAYLQFERLTVAEDRAYLCVPCHLRLIARLGPPQHEQVL